MTTLCTVTQRRLAWTVSALLHTECAGHKGSPALGCGQKAAVSLGSSQGVVQGARSTLILLSIAYFLERRISLFLAVLALCRWVGFSLVAETGATLRCRVWASVGAQAQ